MSLKQSYNLAKAAFHFPDGRGELVRRYVGAGKYRVVNILSFARELFEDRREPRKPHGLLQSLTIQTELVLAKKNVLKIANALKSVMIEEPLSGARSSRTPAAFYGNRN